MKCHMDLEMLCVVHIITLLRESNLRDNLKRQPLNLRLYILLMGQPELAVLVFHCCVVFSVFPLLFNEHLKTPVSFQRAFLIRVEMINCSLYSDLPKN